jgi:hypothetical protein
MISHLAQATRSLMPEHRSAAPLGEPKRRTGCFTAVATVLAVVWFLALSQGLGFRPNGLPIVRNDVLFNSDAASWVEWLAGEARQTRPSPLHALLNLVWRPIARSLFAGYQLFLPHEVARVLAARTLVAVVAGLGFGCLVFLASIAGVSPAKRVIIASVYLLFSANMLVVAPEHWGLSNGLLSACGLLVCTDPGRRVKIVLLCVLTVLLAGTTITNAVYPGVALCWEIARGATPEEGKARLEAFFSPRSFAFAGLAVAATLMAAIIGRGVIASKAPNLAGHLSGYLHLRVIRDPGRAAVDVLSEFVYPAVAPLPEIGPQGLTYRSFDRCTWLPLQIVAASAWIVLLGRCAASMASTPETRGVFIGLAGWIFFNSALHSIWGDEVFLYTPHWSWCLAVVVFLGARKLSMPFVATMSLLIIPGQIQTLEGVMRAVRAL